MHTLYCCNPCCKHIYVRPVEFILRQDQFTKVRAHPGGLERIVARPDCSLVCLRADYLPNRANAELRRQPCDVQHVADHERMDMPYPAAMTAITTLQPKFQSIRCQGHAPVMRRRVVAETDVEAIHQTVDVVLAGADQED